MNDLVGGKLLLVGCGKMGNALLQGWLAEGLPAADVVVHQGIAWVLSLAGNRKSALRITMPA